MSQGYNNLNRELDVLFGNNVRSNQPFVGSGYQQMLKDTAPKTLDDIAGRMARDITGIDPDRVKKVIVKKNTPLTNAQISKANLKLYGNTLKTTGKGLGKVTGKVAAPIGAGMYAYDAYENNAIADELERLKGIYPDRVPQQAIDYHRNKARAIEAGMGIGGTVGAVGGAGLGGIVGLPATPVCSIAAGTAGAMTGGLAGAGWGGTAGEGLYWLLNRNNKYKDWYNSDDYYNLVNGLNVANNKPQPNNQVNTAQPVVSNNAQQLPNTVPSGNMADFINNRVAEYGMQNDVPQNRGEIIANTMQNYPIADEYSKTNDTQVQAIANLINNYPKLARDSQRQQLRNAALAGLSGNPYYANIKPTTQLDNEVSRVNLINELVKARQSEIDRVNNLKGNIAIARQLNLPDEAALAEKELFRTYVSIKGIDAKLYNAQTNLDRALIVQMLKNQGASDRQLSANEAKQIAAAISSAGNIQAYGGNGIAFYTAIDKLRKGQPLTPEEQTALQQVNNTSQGEYNFSNVEGK